MDYFLDLDEKHHIFALSKGNNDTVNDKVILLNYRIMTIKNFNAKKMLMSTVAAVVFSFVFTTNANALPLENKQVDNLEIRVKGCPNQDNQNKQEDFDFASFISYVLQNIFGVRV